MNTFLGKRNLLGIDAANTAGIWSLADITQMRHYAFITDSSRFTIIQTFKTSGSWVAPEGVNAVDEYLVVGGGGGGGSWLDNVNNGAGGGAGGFRTGTSYAVTPGNTYTITVGAGGAGGATNGAAGNAGSASVFDTITSAGGGGGGGNGNGTNGGSGGGGGGTSSTSSGGLGNTPSTSP